MDEIINEFLLESHENLDQLDIDFIELEKNTQDKALLTSIFRVIHIIKGTCGFLDFTHLEKVTHQGENLLNKLRDGTVIKGKVTEILELSKVLEHLWPHADKVAIEPKQHIEQQGGL